VFDKAIAEE